MIALSADVKEAKIDSRINGCCRLGCRFLIVILRVLAMSFHNEQWTAVSDC